MPKFFSLSIPIPILTFPKFLNISEIFERKKKVQINQLKARQHNYTSISDLFVTKTHHKMLRKLISKIKNGKKNKHQTNKTNASKCAIKTFVHARHFAL